jgi:hypothetical protein
MENTESVISYPAQYESDAVLRDGSTCTSAPFVQFVLMGPVPFTARPAYGHYPH